MATKYYEDSKSKDEPVKAASAAPAPPVPLKGSLDDRTRAVELALEAHRGKGLSADAVVREAAIFEKYLIEGATAPATDAGQGQPVDAGMPKAT